MRSIPFAASLVGAVIAAGAPALAQNIPVRTLAKPEVEYSEPLTQVNGVRELRDGRVIVIDPRDKVVQVVDFKSGTAEKVGREGAGPGEYSLPQRIFALPNDSSAVLDMLNRRLLVVLPNGKPGGFIDLNSGAGGGGRGGFVMMGASVSAVDAKGRFYSSGAPFRMTDNGPQAVDSTAIERWDRAANKRDTVGFLPVPAGSVQIGGGGGRGGGRANVSMRIGGGNPFAAQDQWTVAPDGRVAVVHAADYRIDWIDASGRGSSTPAIKFDRIKVTEGHKKEWRDGMRNRMGLMIRNENGKQSAQSMPMTNIEEPKDWPEYMPPFLSGALSFSNDGLLWVRRTGPAGSQPTYDLIDGAGKVAQRVVLPKKSQLVGFGSGTVYVVRSDDDDLQYLQRYRFTAAERP